MPDSLALPDLVVAAAFVAAAAATAAADPRAALTNHLTQMGLGADGSAALVAGLWTSALLSYGFQLVNYALSRARIADNFTGLVEFLPAALLGLARSGCTPRQVLLTAMLASWSARLGLFLLGRMGSRSAPDGRMDALRAQSGVVKAGLLGFWLVHGSWGVVVSLPITLANALDDGAPLNALDGAGLALWAVGMALEACADRAKLAAHLRRDKARYFHLGPLWDWTRHPNFAGETLCWIGAALVSCNLGGVWAWAPWVGALSPAMTLVLMLGEAGLLAELKNNHRFGDSQEFRRYREGTCTNRPPSNTAPLVTRDVTACAAGAAQGRACCGRARRRSTQRCPRSSRRLSSSTGPSTDAASERCSDKS